MSAYAYHVKHKNGWGTGFGPRPTHCHQCGSELPLSSADTGAVGYGCGEPEPVSPRVDAKGESLERSPAVCYTCCAAGDKARMIETGRATLYLTFESGVDDLYTDSCGARRKAFGRYIDGELSNWPGSLKLPCRVHIGHHNIARVRYDVTFRGVDGRHWRGTQYGDNTQLCYCRRLKGGA